MPAATVGCLLARLRPHRLPTRTNATQGRLPLAQRSAASAGQVCQHPDQKWRKESRQQGARRYRTGHAGRDHLRRMLDQDTDMLTPLLMTKLAST
jgi:hypothetical protein